MDSNHSENFTLPYSSIPPTTTMPVDLREILIKLKFLSMIQRGNKINTNNLSFVDADSLWGAALRTYQQENRRATVNFIGNIIDQTIDIINKYNSTIFIKNIINSLNSARIGIKELSDTYRSDPETVSKLSVYLENIDLQLVKYRSLIKGYEYIEHPPSESEKPEPSKETETKTKENPKKNRN